MSAIPSVDSLIFIWLLFTAGGVIIVLLALCWAFKTGQFRDPEHCARLPLEGMMPAPAPEAKHADKGDKHVSI